MKQSLEQFDAHNLHSTKEMRLVVKLNFANPVYFTSHNDIAITGDVLPAVLKKTSSISQQLNPIEGRSTIGTINFELVDIGGIVTDKIRQKDSSGEGLKGVFVELYLGYKGLSFNDYRLEQTQVIDKSVSYQDGLYRFQCRDIQRELKRDIFDLAKTRLAADLLIEETELTVYDTEQFEPAVHDAAYSINPSTSVYYLQIKYQNGFEIISATGKTSNTFTGVTRGLFGTDEIDHLIPIDANQDNGPEVIEFVYLEGTAPQLAYNLLTGKSFTGASVLPASWHLGMAEDFVDKSQFENIGEDLHNKAVISKGFFARFEGLKKTDGKRFVETELCLLMGAFMPVGADGKLGLKRMTGVLSDADFVLTVDETNTTKASALTYELNRIHNVFDIHWSYIATLSGQKPEYFRRNALLDAGSIAKWGQVNAKVLKFKGLHSERHTFSTIRSKFNALRDRHSAPPELINLELLHSLNGLEVGDIVKVKLDHIKDYKGATTLNRSMEVQQITIDQINGKVSARLFGSSAAEPIADDDLGLDSELPDAWYNQSGIPLSTVLTIDPAGFLIENGALIGGSSTRTIFYYLGDLTIPSDITLSITGNVELRVRGHFQINGTVSTVGGGRVATSAGNAGFIGTGRAGGGVLLKAQQPDRVFLASLVSGLHSVLPVFDVVNNGGVLEGVPQDMAGSGGGTGGDVKRWSNDAMDWELIAIGGNGGDGGGSLFVVSRGAGFGGNGLLDLSGTDAQGGMNSGVKNYYSGSGMGGAPGGAFFLIDGSSLPTPILAGNVTAKWGESPEPIAGKGGIDLKTAAARWAYVPVSRIPYPDALLMDKGFSGIAKFRQPLAPDDAQCNKVYGRNLRTGDEWVVTSDLSVYVLKYWSGVAWIADPIQSDWSLVTGAGKPADNATRNTGALADRNNVDWSMDVISRPPNLTALSGSENIQNTLISMNPDGSLSGAGIGQVTIGGLGYTGALNADVTNYSDSRVVNTQLSIAANGQLLGGGGGQVNLLGLGFTGASNANYITDTNQLIDGANLGSTASWPNVTGVDRPANRATSSAALNNGSEMDDISRWFAGDNGTTPGVRADFSIATISDGVTGNKCLQVSDDSTYSDNFFSENIPIDPSKTYIVSVWMRQISGNRRNYLLVNFKDGNKTNFVASNSDAVGWSSKGTYHYFGRVNQAAPSTWTEYSIIFGPKGEATMPTGTRFCNIGGLISRDGSTNTVIQFQQFKLIDTSLLNSEQSWSDVKGPGRPADSATVGANWFLDVVGRPIELTDNRIVNGLDSLGNVARDVPDGRILANAVTQHQTAIDAFQLLNNAGTRNTQISMDLDGQLIGGGGGQVTINGLGYYGHLGATMGATWNLDVIGKPADDDLLNTVVYANGLLRNNLLSVEEWVEGISSFTGDFRPYGASSAHHNQIVQIEGPQGDQVLAWKATTLTNQVGTGSWSGGFQHSIFESNNRFHHTKSYRFACWVKLSDISRPFYMGYGSVNVSNLGAGSVANSNPYAFSNNRPPLANKWYLLVAVTHGSSYTGTGVSGMSGYYDPDTGIMVKSATAEYKHLSTTNYLFFRISQYRRAIGDTVEFVKPRVDELNGNEPSIVEMLGTATVGADWASNISTRPPELTDGRIPGTINAAGQLVNSTVIQQGSASNTYRTATMGLDTGVARDGNVVNFATPWDIIPSIKFSAGGLSQSSGLASGNQFQDIKALNLSTSGFTVSAKLKELAGSTVLRTDVGVTTTGLLDAEIHKSQAAQAFDDQYTFQYDVTINNIWEFETSQYLPGNVTVGIYTNDGTGWVKRATVIHSGTAGQASSTTKANQTKTITVDGLTNHGGREFGINIESATSGGSIVFDNVKYTTASAPAETSATPGGAPSIQYFVLGGE